MAAVTATVKGVVFLSGPYDAGTPSSRARQVRAIIYCTNGSTQVAGGTDTLDIAVNTILAAATQNGRTYTLRTAAIAQMGDDGTDAFGGTISISSSLVSLTPKEDGDFSTNDTIAASAMTIPYGLFVLAEES
jgi:hypothetical protein